jgi:hypothetical protein
MKPKRIKMRKPHEMPEQEEAKARGKKNYVQYLAQATAYEWISNQQVWGWPFTADQLSGAPLPGKLQTDFCCTNRHNSPESGQLALATQRFSRWLATAVAAVLDPILSGQTLLECRETSQKP